MNIQFRIAEPKDQNEACPLIYSAAPEAFDYMFALNGKSALDFLRFAFMDGSGLFGCQNHVVATVGNRVVGTGAFYSGKEYASLGFGNTKQVFRFFGFSDGWSVFRKCLRVQKLIPPPDKDMEYVADLGVKESFRSQGIGTALLKHQMDIARAKNRRSYSLDVAANNPRAQKLYESLGFKVANERQFLVSGKLGPIPNVRRMEIDLSDEKKEARK